MTVMLTTAPLVYGSNYTLVINHVRDRAASPTPLRPIPRCALWPRSMPPWTSGKPSVPSVVTPVGTNGLDVSSAGTQVGGQADQFSFSYQFRTGDFDVAVRLAGMVRSDVWAKAGLMARESLVPSGRFAATLATPAMVGSGFEWRDPAGSQANATGSFPANYPDTWLRLKRAGVSFTGFASYDGQSWTQLGSAAIAMPSQIYLGFAVSSYNADAGDRGPVPRPGDRHRGGDGRPAQPPRTPRAEQPQNAPGHLGDHVPPRARAPT